MARNTLVTLKQVISKSRQDRQIWDVNDGVILRLKYVQIKWVQAMKESTPGINNCLGATITLDGIFSNKKKEESKKLSYDISQ